MDLFMSRLRTIQKASVSLLFNLGPEILQKSSKLYIADIKDFSEPSKIRAVSSACWLILTSSLPVMPLLFRTVLAKISAARINKYGERGLSVYKHCGSIYCRRYRECSQRQIPSFKRKVGALQLHRTQKIKECGIKYGFFVRAKIWEIEKSWRVEYNTRFRTRYNSLGWKFMPNFNDWRRWDIAFIGYCTSLFVCFTIIIRRRFQRSYRYNRMR